MASKFPPWSVIWHDLCPEEPQPNNTTQSAFDECQQHIIHIPLYLLIAVLSAYHFGRQAFLIVRNQTQITAIHLRIIATLLLASLPIIRCYIYLAENDEMWPIDVLVSSFETITWIVHIGNCK